MSTAARDTEDRCVYVVDRLLPHANKVQCCLVLGDNLTQYLGAPDADIELSINEHDVVVSPQGRVSVSLDELDDDQWNALMDRHPELLSDGVSCTNSTEEIMFVHQSEPLLITSTTPARYL